MLNLIKIEIRKMLRSKVIFVSFLVCIIAFAGFGFFLKQDSFSGEESATKEEQLLQEEYSKSTDWKEQLRIQMQLNKYLSDIYGEDEIAVKNQILQYRIEHNIRPFEENTAWDFIVYSFDIIGFLISVFGIIFSVEIVTKEYSNKTVKLLFTKPYSRQKIIMAKYITSVIYGVGLAVFCFLAALIVGGVLFTFEGASAVTVMKFFNAMLKCSLFTESIVYLLSVMFRTIILISIAFLLSLIVKNQTVPLIISLGILCFGNLLADKIYSLGLESMRFSILSNLSLTGFINCPVTEDASFLLFLVTVMIHIIILIFGILEIVKRTDF